MKSDTKQKFTEVVEKKVHLTWTLGYRCLFLHWTWHDHLCDWCIVGAFPPPPPLFHTCSTNWLQYIRVLSDIISTNLMFSSCQTGYNLLSRAPMCVFISWTHVADTSTCRWGVHGTAIFPRCCRLASRSASSASGTVATTTCSAGPWWTGREFWWRTDWSLSLPRRLFAPLS